MADTLPLATATASLGKPEGGHHVETVLAVAAQHGIRGIEIVYEHLQDYAVRKLGQVDAEGIVTAATQVKELCHDLQLQIIVLQPFATYEGLTDRQQHRQAIERMRHWIDVAHALETDLIQMPSNFAPTGTTGDMDVIVADISELAELANSTSPPVRIAYEAVAWGTHIDLWQQSWEVVKRVDRANLGLCLDTFHIAGRVYGDPSSADRVTANGRNDLDKSLELMRSELDVGKIFYVQLSDAERLDAALIPGHDWYQSDDNPRMTWSRAARLFPLEESQGGYLPVIDIARTIVNDVGYRGWISMEVFSRHLRYPGSKDVPEQYARRAVDSYQKVHKLLSWESLA